MASSRTTQEALLREVYMKKMQVQFNLRSILSQFVNQDTEEYAEGKQLSLILHKGQTGGFGYSSAGVLPTPSHQKVARHVYNYSRLYGTIEISGPHVEGARKSYAAERRPYDFETKNLVKQMRHAFNFDLFGDGSGLIASPLSASSSTVMIVDDIRGLEDGMRVDVLLTAAGGVGGGVQAADISVDPATNTITLTAGSFADGTGTEINTNPSNYGVYRAGSYKDVVMGLQGIVSASNPPGGNLGGIDRTTAGNEYWKAQVLSNGSVAREPSFDLIDDMITLIEKRSDGNPNLILCGYEVHNILKSELLGSRRFHSSDLKKLNGWATALMHDEIPIVRDKHCPPGKMFILDTTMFTMFANDSGKWMDQDGAVLSRVPGLHAYQAAWFCFKQLVCSAPNANGVISDLSTVTGP